MTLRQYLFTMICGTILCLVAWFFVLSNVDPYEANAVGFFFFYASTFLGIMGLSSLVFFFVYRFFAREALPLFKYVQKSFRESTVFAFFSTLLLFLQAHSLLKLWNLIILCILFVLYMSFKFSVKKMKQNDTYQEPSL